MLHLPIFDFFIPQNAMTFFNKIMPVAAFDLIEALNIPYLEMLLHEREDLKSEINIKDQTMELGYDSHNPVLNLGTMHLMINIYLLKLSILFLILYPCRYMFGFFRKTIYRLKK